MVKFSQLCTEYFIDFPTLPGWSVTESHHIWFDLYPALTHEHLTLSLPSFSPRQSKLCLTHPTTSPSLHFPSEEFQTTHFSPPSVEFNPPVSRLQPYPGFPAVQWLPAPPVCCPRWAIDAASLFWWHSHT